MVPSMPPSTVPRRGLVLSQSTPPVCTPGHSHPPSKKRRGLRQYWLFQATLDGCKECVAYFLTTENLDPNSASLNEVQAPTTLRIYDKAIGTVYRVVSDMHTQQGLVLRCEEIDISFSGVVPYSVRTAVKMYHTP